jgi:hypothetical protein
MDVAAVVGALGVMVCLLFVRRHVRAARRDVLTDQTLGKVPGASCAQGASLVAMSRYAAGGSAFRVRRTMLPPAIPSAAPLFTNSRPGTDTPKTPRVEPTVIRYEIVPYSLPIAPCVPTALLLVQPESDATGTSDGSTNSRSPSGTPSTSWPPSSPRGFARAWS